MRVRFGPMLAPHGSVGGTKAADAVAAVAVVAAADAAVAVVAVADATAPAAAAALISSIFCWAAFSSSSRMSSELPG